MPAYKDTNGTWYASYFVKDHTGRSIRKKKRGFKTKRDADRFIAEQKLKSETNLEMVPVSDVAASMGGSQVFLDSGKEYKAGELIKSIIVASANDSCVAMAERLSGSVEGFVKDMNERANALRSVLSAMVRFALWEMAI